MSKHGMRVWFLVVMITCMMPLAVAGDDFNYIIGTQTFGAAYQFTREPKLIETARAILEMGSNTIKFGMGGKRENIGSLAVLAEQDPVFRQVFAMPFTYYLMWADGVSINGYKSFLPGRDDGAEQKEYREIYDFTRYLLRTFNGTGKQFYIGHWEGDWLLVGAGNKTDPAPENVTAMVRWLTVRQRAVDDARRETPHDRVGVWHYAEVNLVRKAMAGGRTMTNDVLPRVDVDYVSYSAYDSLNAGELRESLFAALNYIEGKLKHKPGVPGRRVFIGEYGFPAVRFSPREQAARSRDVMRAGIEWGCPFVLYWEMYNNEVDKDRRQRGFWLIDDKGVKQPAYSLHQYFYNESIKFIANFRKKDGRKPAEKEFRRKALEILDRFEI